MQVLKVWALAAAMSVATSAGAATYHSAIAFSSPQVTIDFAAGLPAGAYLDDVYAGQGVTFENLQQDYDSANIFPHTSGPSAVNFAPCCVPTAATFTINFSWAVTDALFTLVTNESTTPTLIQAFLGGVLVDSQAVFAGTFDPNNIYGFVDTRFDQIVVTPESENNGAALIDNLQFNFAPTPEPATWAVMVLGFGGVGAVLRRRNRVAAA